MIKLTKLNGVVTLINSDQIEYIEAIPESKIVMMNGEYILVMESMDIILDKVISYRQRCCTLDIDKLKKLLSLDGHVENIED